METTGIMGTLQEFHRVILGYWKNGSYYRVYWGYSRDDGKENGSYYIVYWNYSRDRMEKKVETTIMFRSFWRSGMIMFFSSFYRPAVNMILSADVSWSRFKPLGACFAVSRYVTW